jgi:hypothetical protein
MLRRLILLRLRLLHLERLRLRRLLLRKNSANRYGHDSGQYQT